MLKFGNPKRQWFEVWLSLFRVFKKEYAERMEVVESEVEKLYNKLKFLRMKVMQAVEVIEF